jgi:hypothetical protein
MVSVATFICKVKDVTVGSNIATVTIKVAVNPADDFSGKSASTVKQATGAAEGPSAVIHLSNEDDITLLGADQSVALNPPV